MSPASVVAVLFLFAVAIAHLVRVILGTDIVVDGMIVPMWASLVACVGVGALGVWLWRDERKRAVA